MNKEILKKEHTLNELVNAQMNKLTASPGAGRFNDACCVERTHLNSNVEIGSLRPGLQLLLAARWLHHLRHFPCHNWP
jgi:hypothetical protein